MKVSYLIYPLLLVSFCYANDPAELGPKKELGIVSFNNERFNLLQNIKQERQEETLQRQKKSGLLAALYSAILPGAGEYYSEAYWKSALFLTLEVISWTSHVVYTDKGETKDSQMRSFGDENWSEQRYWTNIYNDAVAEGSWGGAGAPGGNLLPESFITDNKSFLRAYERDSHTHVLPSTKTQQYYEMIYKYLAQFGVGWVELDELGLGWDYYDVLGVELTGDVKRYRKLRNQSNGFYETATTMANVAMFNHLVSALDAAWSVKNYNKKIDMALMAESKYYAGEHVATYGLFLSW